MDPQSRIAHEARRRKATGAALLLAGVVVMVTSTLFAGTAAATNPRGNNGTIKIDGVALNGGQANEPHVDCEFALEFSGYDKGDLKASVTFALQAPTRRPSGSQVLLTDTLAIGEDAAGGATDLDAARLYQLDFTGVTPHPQQGYHVKVTIHADGSQGADTKHKVFWVQPCAAPTTTTTTTSTTTTSSSSSTTTTVTTGTATTQTTAAVLGTQETPTTAAAQVLGEQLTRPELPRTGSGLDRLALLGGLALALAGCISLFSGEEAR
jgi:hypothetical protein